MSSSEIGFLVFFANFGLKGVIKHLGENPHRVLEKGLNLLGFVEVYTSRFLSIY